MRDGVYYPEDEDGKDPAPALARPIASDVERGIDASSTDELFRPTRGAVGDGRSDGTTVTRASTGVVSPGVALPVNAPRVVARTHETAPAVGTPVREGAGGGTTVVATRGGVYEFVSPMWVDDARYSREALERELARELGVPGGELPIDLETLVLARQLGRVVRMFAVVDIVLCVLYALQGSYTLTILILGPVCGYVGAKKYSSALTSAYVGFLVVSLAWRVVNFIVYTNVTARVLSLITIVFAFYIARLVARFYSILRLIPPNGQILLRNLDAAHFVHE